MEYLVQHLEQLQAAYLVVHLQQMAGIWITSVFLREDSVKEDGAERPEGSKDREAKKRLVLGLASCEKRSPRCVLGFSGGGACLPEGSTHMTTKQCLLKILRMLTVMLSTRAASPSSQDTDTCEDQGCKRSGTQQAHTHWPSSWPANQAFTSKHSFSRELASSTACLSILGYAIFTNEVCEKSPRAWGFSARLCLHDPPIATSWSHASWARSQNFVKTRSLQSRWHLPVREKLIRLADRRAGTRSTVPEETFRLG